MEMKAGVGFQSVHRKTTGEDFGLNTNAPISDSRVAAGPSGAATLTNHDAFDCAGVRHSRQKYAFEPITMTDLSV